MKGLIKLTSTIYMCLLAVCTANAQLSVETLGVIRHKNITQGPAYGAGVDIGYKFNKYVSGHVRAVAYEENDWGGSVIDEGSLLVRATLLRSENNAFSLYAIGGGDRSFGVIEDWGFSVGLGARLTLYKQLHIGADSRVRAWIKQEKDLVSSAFIGLSF